MILNNIRILTWFNFFVDFRLYAPVAIIYFSQISGSFTLGMSVFSVVMLSAALFELPTGIFSDKIGRKKTAMMGALASVMAVTLYAIGLNYYYLVLGALFEGLARSFYSGNNDALLHDTLREAGKEKEFHTYAGKTHSMFSVAAAVSGLFGGLIAYYSFSLVMWLSVIPQIACVVLSLYFIDPKKITKESTNIFAHLKEAIQQFVRNRNIRLLSLSSMIAFGIGEAIWEFQSAFYNTVWPLWAVGFAKTLSFTGAAVSFYFSGKVIDKVGPFKLLLIANIYSKISNSLAVIFPTIASPLIMTTNSLFHGSASTAERSLLQKEFTNEQRATMGSLNSFGGSIVFAIIALLVGMVGDYFSPAKAILFFMLLSSVNILIYYKLFNHNKNE